jgi:hypothetical protein
VDPAVASEVKAGECVRRRRLAPPTIGQLWAFAAVALPVVAALRATLPANDLAYQIRAGEIMVRTHHVIRVDPFTFTAFGRPWLDQQWGAQILFDLVYRAGGWVGLALFRSALVGCIYLLVFLACRAAGARIRTAAWLTVAGFTVSAGGLALRPQLLGMALFACVVWLVFERHRHPRWVWIVPVVTALWANLHGSFFLAPFLLGLAWLGDVHDRKPRAARTLAVALASAAAATLNPFGLRVWAYAVGISTNPVITRVITEWQPPTVRDATGAVFFASIVAVAGFLVLRARTTSWPTLLFLGVFVLIGLEAVRGIFWWGLVAPPMVAQLLPIGKEPQVDRSWVNGVFAAVIVAVGLSSLPLWRTGSRTAPSPRLVTIAPVAVTAELRRVLRPGERFFDPVPWASWFELNLPRNPVFLDPRIEIFPKQILDQHEDVSLGRQGWQWVLDRWGIRVVAADRGEEGQLIPIIERDPGWREVYADPEGAVFVRIGA